MALNPDQIRVDLLRIKRKLYISYPEGSKERRDFLLTSKLSELNHLQKMISPDVSGIVFEEYDKQQKSEAVNITLSLLGGGCLSVMLLGFHQLHPQNVWLNLWTMPAFMGFFYGMTHVIHVINQWQSLQPFKKEYDRVTKKIEKILKEIQDLSKK